MREVTSKVLFPILLTTLLVTAGCSGGTDRPAADATPAASTGNAAPVAAADVPDACTFYSRDELEKALGWELREGERKDVSAGSACDFETPPGMYVTRNYPNPPIPKSAGFSSLTVNTHPVDPANFAEFRNTLGAAAEDVPGIGEGAYFYGPNLLYVRVGNRGFSLRIYTDEGNDADRARVRDVMLTLARTGAGKLA